MLSEERRTQILQLIQENGKVRVRELSRRFNTSEVTIRNDLRKLHERGHLQRAHGGAITPETVRVDPSLYEKAKLHAAEKQRIGAAAAALVNNGETIILDSGTTTQQIARHIRNKKNLKVITNAINVAMEILGLADIEVILLGGVVRRNSFSVVGHFATDMLKHLLADKLFIGVDACDLNFGLTTPNLEESHVNRAMVQIAREKILVADSSKFGKHSLSRIVSVFEMDKVISDRNLPESIQSALRAEGVDVLLV
ncbi:MAG: transcriptional repressor AgaR [Acidobacteriota bacterium]